jgi:hypothetical protein
MVDNSTDTCIMVILNEKESLTMRKYRVIMTEAQITTILSVFIDYADLVDVEDVEGEDFYEVMGFLDKSLQQEPVVSLQLVT